MEIKLVVTKKGGKFYQYTCNCSAYKFPHRLGAGKCKLINHIKNEFINNYGSAEPCNNCNNFIDFSCQVVGGIESLEHCLIVQEMERACEIKFRYK